MKKYMECFMVLFLMIIILWFLGGEEENDTEYKIGVICGSEANTLLKQYIAYVETYFPVEIEVITPSMGYNSYTEITKKLCRNHAQIILNATTDEISEILDICEEKEVYLMQFWDMPEDTDLLEKCRNSSYFLGYIKNNEKQAIREMAKVFGEANCRNILILENYYLGQSSTVHKIRSSQMLKELEKILPDCKVKVIRGARSQFAAVQNLVRQGIIPDGIFLTTGINDAELGDIKEVLGNENVQLAWFNANRKIEEQLKKGNHITVACGQNNIFGLAFAVAWRFLTTGYKEDSMIEMECNYLIVSSLEDYEKLLSKTIEKVPYDYSELMEISDSLSSGTEVLARYCQKYSLKEN